MAAWFCAVGCCLQHCDSRSSDVTKSFKAISDKVVWPHHSVYLPHLRANTLRYCYLLSGSLHNVSQSFGSEVPYAGSIIPQLYLLTYPTIWIPPCLLEQVYLSYVVQLARTSSIMRVVTSSSPDWSENVLIVHITYDSCYVIIEAWLSVSEPAIIRRSA